MTENTPTPAERLADQLRRAAEAIEDHEGDSLGDDSRTFDEWVRLSDAAKAVERLDALTAERDALAAVIEQVKDWHPRRNAPEKLYRILDAAPALVLAQVKADAWDEGAEAGYGDGYNGREGDDVTPNPYRIEREAQG